MDLFAAVYPYIVLGFGIIDAGLLLFVGAFVALEFLRKGSDAADFVDDWKRFVPATMFFVSFNVMAMLLLAGAQYLMGLCR